MRREIRKRIFRNLYPKIIIRKFHGQLLSKLNETQGRTKTERQAINCD